MVNKKSIKKEKVPSLGVLLLLVVMIGVYVWYTNMTKNQAGNPVGEGSMQNKSAPQENDDRLQSNIPGNLLGANTTSIVVEREGMRYFLSRDGDRADYQKLTGLYRQGVGDITAERIAYGYIENPQVLGNFVYYRGYYKDDRLYRVDISAEEPKQEIVAEGVSLYSLYDHWVYYWNKSDTYMYRLDLADAQAIPQKLVNFGDLASLVARGDFILGVERDINRSAQRVETSILVWRLSPDGLKKDILISIPTLRANFVQPYHDRIYYLQDNKIWRIDLAGENKEQVYTPDDFKIRSFIIYDNRIYTEEYSYKYPHIYASVNLEGGDKWHIFTYRSPGGPEDPFNSVMDGMHIIGFNVTQEYLFIGGYSSYNGEFLTTRVLIAGDAEGKEEEVFFNGTWGSIWDYIKEIRRVQALKGLAP
ncbi:MAG: DUF5050 domain-containing protein [Caulobacteraceae bacterium]